MLMIANARTHSHTHVLSATHDLRILVVTDAAVADGRWGETTVVARSRNYCAPRKMAVVDSGSVTPGIRLTNRSVLLRRSSGGLTARQRYRTASFPRKLQQYRCCPLFAVIYPILRATIMVPLRVVLRVVRTLIKYDIRSILRSVQFISFERFRIKKTVITPCK